MGGPPGPNSRRARGARAEEEAAAWLCAQGFVILARNWCIRGGELDLVARERDTLCFLEVKSRRSGTFGQALESITPVKQARLVRTAVQYLQEHPWDGQVRFDLVCRDGAAGAWILYRDAFRAEAP